MKPNFEMMSKSQLRAYVLEHKEDMEALRALMIRRDPQGIKYNFPNTEEGLEQTKAAIERKIAVKFNVPFESLIEAVISLDIPKKHRLLEILEKQLFEAEEDSIEQEPQDLDEIEQARQAYHRGDYQTIQEYIAG